MKRFLAQLTGIFILGFLLLTPFVQSGDIALTDINKLVAEATGDMSEVTANSIAYRILEIERHHHGNEKWFGLAGTPSGETHRAGRITLNPASFQADAGNDTWGSWLQIMGSEDSPVVAGNAYYDFHKILVTDHERNSTVYKMQIAGGESAGLAAKISAEEFTEIMFITPGAAGGQNDPLEVMSPRAAAGVKCWIRILAKGADTGTLDFTFALHEYEG